MPEAIEDMLANTSLFARVDRVHLGEIAAWVQLQTFDTGQAIEREGELGTALHVIRSGGVDVYQGYGSDNQQHLASFGEGDFFGEMALLLGRPRSATIIANEPTECIVILRNTVEEQATVELLWSMLHHVAERLSSADEQLGRAGALAGPRQPARVPTMGWAAQPRIVVAPSASTTRASACVPSPLAPCAWSW